MKEEQRKQRVDKNQLARHGNRFCTHELHVVYGLWVLLFFLLFLLLFILVFFFFLSFFLPTIRTDNNLILFIGS